MFQYGGFCVRRTMYNYIKNVVLMSKVSKHEGRRENSVLCPPTPKKLISLEIPDLPSSVVNLSEEISIIILGGLAILSQPQRQDEVVSSKENGQ